MGIYEAGPHSKIAAKDNSHVCKELQGRKLMNAHVHPTSTLLKRGRRTEKRQTKLRFQKPYYRKLIATVALEASMEHNSI